MLKNSLKWPKISCSSTLSCHFWPLAEIFDDLIIISGDFVTLSTEKHCGRNGIDHGCPCRTEFHIVITLFCTDANDGFSKVNYRGSCENYFAKYKGIWVYLECIRFHCACHLALQHNDIFYDLLVIWVVAPNCKDHHVKNEMIEIMQTVFLDIFCKGKFSFLSNFAKVCSWRSSL